MQLFWWFRALPVQPLSLSLSHCWCYARWRSYIQTGALRSVPELTERRAITDPRNLTESPGKQRGFTPGCSSWEPAEGARKGPEEEPEERRTGLLQSPSAQVGILEVVFLSGSLFLSLYVGRCDMLHQRKCNKWINKMKLLCWGVELWWWGVYWLTGRWIINCDWGYNQL